MFSFSGGVSGGSSGIIEEGFRPCAFEIVGIVEVRELLRGCSMERGGSENVFHGDRFWRSLEDGDFRRCDVSTGYGGPFNVDGGFVWTRVSWCEG